MKLVYRLVFAELLGPFMFGVMAFTSVTFAGSQLLQISNWLLSGAISLNVALKLIALMLPSIVVFTLPMSTLLAVLLGIGRLSGDSEVVALYAGGISFYRIAIPVLILGIAVSGGSVAMNELLVPWAHGQIESIRAEVMNAVPPSRNAFSVGDDTLSLEIAVRGGMNPETGTLKNIMITQFAVEDMLIDGKPVKKNQPIWVVYADRAEWDGLKDDSKQYNWRLYDGYVQQVGTDKYVMWSFTGSRSETRELGKTPAQFALYQKTKMRNTDQLSFSELTQIVEQLKKNPNETWEKINEFDVNRWNKFALPLSSLVFALLAAPLGIRPSRSGSSVGFGLSILLILLYWIAWHYTSHLAIDGNLPTPIGAFAADILGTVTALWLISKAAK